MRKLSTLAAAAAFSISIAQAQTCDLVFFSDDGQKFTLIVDGDQKNAAPATRVVATGIKNETPMCLIRFEDKAIAEIKKGGYFPLGKEYTVMITTNKKGERVLRPSGEAALGTAVTTEPKLAPANFQDDDAGNAGGENLSASQQASTGGVQSTTSTTITQTTTDGGNGENVSMSMGVNGVGINMNVNVDDDMDMSGMQSTTTTTTTTSSTTSSQVANSAAVENTRPAEPAAYHMPGYSGEVGCPWPMNPNEFTDAKGSIESKSFEDTKMTMAKQIAGDRCMTVEQVKGVMGLFSFEDSKLDFAKFAYDHTYDISNYYKVNDVFSFESSVEELNEYIRSH